MTADDVASCWIVGGHIPPLQAGNEQDAKTAAQPAAGRVAANHMVKQTKLGPISRGVAAILSLVWGCAGILGLVVAYAFGRWVLVLAALFALWYASLWAHVVAGARLVAWNDIARPWRRHSPKGS